MEHKDFSQIPWHGIPRKEIDWYPKIIEESCIGCGLCYLTCGRDVYDFDFKNKKPVVARPYNCMVGCNTCGMICNQDAIEFPSLGFLRKIIKANKVVSRARKKIRGIELEKK
jgi:NAD-dependent dihydropyrimidine dehydrogenase PreA subunit